MVGKVQNMFSNPSLFHAIHSDKRYVQMVRNNKILKAFDLFNDSRSRSIATT